MKRSTLYIMSLLVLLPSFSFAVLPPSITRFPSGVPAGSIVTVTNATGNYNIYVDGIFQDDFHPEIIIETVNGDELLAADTTYVGSNDSLSGVIFPYGASYTFIYSRWEQIAYNDATKASKWSPHFLYMWCTPTTDPVNFSPITAAELKAIFLNNIGTSNPPQSFGNLSTVNAKLDKLLLTESFNAPDSPAAALIPAALKDKITPKDFALASGVTGVLAAFVISMVWIRGL